MDSNSKHLANIWFDHVRHGHKTCEGRLDKGFWGQLDYGDIITFHNDFNEKCQVKVVGTHRYARFRDMIEHETLEKTLPGITNLDQGVAVYHEFYSKEQELMHGVVAILISLV